MSPTPLCLDMTNVALRKESVDRNTRSPTARAASAESLSARRAWIEIAGLPDTAHGSGVALRKESVDRNQVMPSASVALWRRSPQGERG